MSEHQAAKAAPIAAPSTAVPAIVVTRFSFAYGSGGVTEEPTEASVLRSVNFSVPVGARVLVVGRNGSGKSTLMRCLAGQHFHQHHQLQVLGQPAFFSSALQRDLTYLGSEWRNSQLVRTDVPVERVLRGAAGFSEARLAELTVCMCYCVLHHSSHATKALLDIEVGAASMARLSDGQRQGVQIAAALMKVLSIRILFVIRFAHFDDSDSDLAAGRSTSCC
jgi:ABC-type uncharacterized transport system ATPase subunit